MYPEPGCRLTRVVKSRVVTGEGGVVQGSVEETWEPLGGGKFDGAELTLLVPHGSAPDDVHAPAEGFRWRLENVYAKDAVWVMVPKDVVAVGGASP